MNTQYNEGYHHSFPSYGDGTIENNTSTTFPTYGHVQIPTTTIQPPPYYTSSISPTQNYATTPTPTSSSYTDTLSEKDSTDHIDFHRTHSSYSSIYDDPDADYSTIPEEDSDSHSSYSNYHYRYTKPDSHFHYYSKFDSRSLDSQRNTIFTAITQLFNT